jgi:hypothetical protein
MDTDASGKGLLRHAGRFSKLSLFHALQLAHYTKNCKDDFQRSAQTTI